MRLALVAVLLLAAALLFAAFAWADQPSANELGRLMILEYHKVDYPEDRWTRTPENFRQDLEALYARGYRLHSLNALLDGRITAPAGTTPIVLTFDDSSPGQFRYVETNGVLEIDPKCAVGIPEAQQWIQRHVPDYKIRTLALPHGVYPREVGWALRGSAKGTVYEHDAILMVAGGAAQSPFARGFD